VRRWACSGLLLGCLLAAPTSGRELFARGDLSLDFTGSLRALTAVSKGTDLDKFQEIASSSVSCGLAALFPDCPAFGVVGRKDTWQNLTRLRTQFDLQAMAGLSAYVAYDHEWRFGTLDTFERGLGDDLRAVNLWDLDWWIDTLGFDRDSDHRNWRHLLYRAYVRFESDQVELTLGRQRIPWGVGRLWNPIDRFNAIPPLALEPDQSGGVDSLDARWLLTGFTFLEGVYAPGPSSDDAAWALRLHGVVFDADYSIMSGVFEEALTVGFDLARNLGPAAFGAEVVYTDPDRDVWPIGKPRPRELDPYWQIVVSVDQSFDLGTGLYGLVEHLYNGNALGFGEGEAGPLLGFFEATDRPPPGVPEQLGPFVKVASLDVFGSSRVVTTNKHTTGLGLGYDLTPILRADLIVLYDWNGESAIFYPTLRYSPLDSLELTLGYQDATGSNRSAYGEIERLGFLTVEWFF
jgi:hypothetical protein